MGHLCTMLGVLYKKMHIGVIRPRIRVRNEISRFLSSGSTARSVLALLDPSPDSSSCSEHISDPKEPNGKFMNSTPPLLGPQPRILGRSTWASTNTPFERLFSILRWNAECSYAYKRSGLSWGDSSIPCGIYIMPRRRRDAMGMRKLKIKKVLKNTFYRKSNGNLISQLKILIQNRAVFETSSTNNFFSRIAYCHTPTFLNAQERQLSNDVGVWQ